MRSIVTHNVVMTSSHHYNVITSSRRFVLLGLALSLCSSIYSGGWLEKNVVRRCFCFCLSRHFRLWSLNGWSNRDGWISVWCAGAAEKPWGQLRTDRLHVQVPHAILHKVAKIVNAAGQTDGLIRLRPGLEEFVNWTEWTELNELNGGSWPHAPNWTEWTDSRPDQAAELNWTNFC